MLAMKAYEGKSKINSVKKVPPKGLNLGPLVIPSGASVTELTYQVLTAIYLTSLSLVHQ